MSVTPLEGPNAGWINNALEIAIEKYGTPRHIISDQASVFTGEVFADLLERKSIMPRLGAIGKHGSISVTERVIKTLKYEWLKRVPLIRSFDHLTDLCDEFESWYNLYLSRASGTTVRTQNTPVKSLLEKSLMGSP